MKRLLSTIVLGAALALPVAQATPAAAKSVPASCIKALDAAESLRSHTADFLSTSVAGFFTRVQANATANDTDVLAFLNQLDDDIGQLTDETSAATPAFTTASHDLTKYGARCRAGR
jgi:hypothetical protein